jgi:hypothetical protein
MTGMEQINPNLDWQVMARSRSTHPNIHHPKAVTQQCRRDFDRALSVGQVTSIGHLEKQHKIYEQPLDKHLGSLTPPPRVLIFKECLCYSAAKSDLKH